MDTNLPPTDSSSTPLAPGTPDDRLDSWKEIAAFFKRDVRTVQRWEKQAGLPVYRHAESRLRTAYAYRSELDRWWRSQRSTLEPPAEAESSPGDGSPGVARPGRTLAAAAVAALLIVTAIVAWRVWRRATPATHSTVVVLLAPFTSESDLAAVAVINEGLEREIVVHPGVTVMAPSKRARMLRLMRRTATTAITVPVAREIAVRAGDVDFVLAGRLRRLGSRYLLGLDAIEPANGALRATFEREVDREDALHSAVHDQAEEMAGALLALGPARTGAALEPVTTASMDALQRYSEAVTAGRGREWAAAELLARRAITADEQFASAYALVGWSIRNRGGSAAESLKFAERAVDLAPQMTEREIYFISGTYHSLAGDAPKALAAYEALLREQPQDRLALDRLIDAYSSAGRVKDAVDRSVRRATAEPDDFYANVRAAYALRIWNADDALAEPFLRRSQSLASPESRKARPYWSAWLTLLPAFDRWLTDDSQGAISSISTVASTLGSRLGLERDALATAVGFSYLSLGRLREADSAFRYAAMPTRQINLVMLALAMDDTAAAREWLAQVPASSADRPAVFAAAGLADDAERGLAHYFSAEHGDGIAEVTRGLIAGARGQTDQAVALLRHGTELLRYSGEPAYFLGVESLARIWIGRHDEQRASSILGEAARKRRRTYASPWWSGAFWIKVNADLLALDEGSGRQADAQRRRETLQRALVKADADYPLNRVIQGHTRAAPVGR